jgi:hypothetical protein
LFAHLKHLTSRPPNFVQAQRANTSHNPSIAHRQIQYPAQYLVVSLLFRMSQVPLFHQQHTAQLSGAPLQVHTTTVRFILAHKTMQMQLIS